MTAEVIPFPLDRRSGTIRNLAARLRKLTTSKAIRNTVGASCDRLQGIDAASWHSRRGHRGAAPEVPQQALV